MSILDLQLDLPRFAAPALCAETDPDAFYPENGGGAGTAKKLCGLCETRIECLDYALQHELVHGWDGVWGGTTPQERRRMLRERRPAAQPPALALRLVQPDPEPALVPEPPSEPTPATSVRAWTPGELAAAATQLRAVGMPPAEIAAALDVPVARVRTALRSRRSA